MSARRNHWMSLGWDAWSLGLESSHVIGLRTWQMALGLDPGGHEAQRMLFEKLEAAAHLQRLALGGPASARAVAHLRRKVRANRRRLTR